MPAAKTDDWRSSLGTYMMKEENQLPQVSSGLLMCIMTHMHTEAHMHTHTINQKSGNKIKTAMPPSWDILVIPRVRKIPGA